MKTVNFCFYLQNRLIQISQTGGQWYSDTSPFSIPWSILLPLFYPGVNFTNILRAAFAPKSFCQKITNPNFKHIKAAKKLSYEKSARKILVKLTPGRLIFLLTCWKKAHFWPFTPNASRVWIWTLKLEILIHFFCLCATLTSHFSLPVSSFCQIFCYFLTVPMTVTNLNP